MNSVGIPRSLSYYTFFPLWKTFLEELTLEVIISAKTNKKLLDLGVKETVNDACIPIKVFHGHVMDLKDKVDYLFIPRMVSADGIATFCPKFLGLPEMVRLSRDDLPPIIGTNYEAKPFSRRAFPFFYAIGKQFGKSFFQTFKAFKKALQVQQNFYNCLAQGFSPVEALEHFNQHGNFNLNPQANDFDLKIAVLGYPYTVSDPYISGNILKNLEKLKVKTYLADSVALDDLQKMSKFLSQNFFWHFSNRVAWSGFHYMKNQIVDGLIHLTAFGCGPDAMLNRVLEYETKHYQQTPFISITIDEHSGEAGILTRLEAYTDMLRYRQKSLRAK